MSSIIRIILGLSILVGTFLAKSKTSAALDENGDPSGLVIMFGREMSSTSVGLLFFTFSAVGITFIVMGVVGLIKQNK